MPRGRFPIHEALRLDKVARAAAFNGITGQRKRSARKADERDAAFEQTTGQVDRICTRERFAPVCSDGGGGADFQAVALDVATVLLQELRPEVADDWQPLLPAVGERAQSP